MTAVLPLPFAKGEHLLRAAKPPENKPLFLIVKSQMLYLDPGERFDDPDEVLLQQVVVQFGQVGADDGVIPQLRLVVCECLGVKKMGGRTLSTKPSKQTQRKTKPTLRV